jgi:competence protein ComEC
MRLLILAFAGGIALLQVQAELPGAAFMSALAILALAALVARRWLRGTGGALVAASSFGAALLGSLLGFIWAGLLAQQRIADQLPLAWEGREIVLTGVVASLPQQLARAERFIFDVESVALVNSFNSFNSPGAGVPRRIMLSWYRERRDADAAEAIDDSVVDEEGAEGAAGRALRPGERWRFTVRLKRPHGNANPHAFDYEAWLFERNIRAIGSVRANGDRQRLDDFVARPGYAIERLRDLIRARFLSALPDAPYRGVLIALAVGDQRAIPNSQWTLFNRTGITHLMSISGLHVTMVAALFALLVNGLWRRSEPLLLWLPAQQASVFAAWLAALAYALVAGFEIPAQRTLYMLTVVALALLSGRNLGVSRTLLLALLAVLLSDPWAVLATGFWLSFGAVALLLLVGSARIGQLRGWRSGVVRWGLAQWAVTVGSLPLLLFFFQQFSLVSPLANALAIPLVSFVITPLALVFALIPWPPLLFLDHWLLEHLMTLLEALGGWPLWQQPAPPLWAVLLALAGVLWLLLPRGFPARSVGICLLLPALFWPPQRPPAGQAWVDVLDVGQGLAVLVRTAGHALLYDAGPLYSAEANAGQRVVVPFLRAVGVGSLDALVLSHRDQDHVGGAAAVEFSLPVARRLTSLDGSAGERCSAGQAWEWDGVRFSILHPRGADYLVAGKKANSMSCVVRVENANGSVLLTADIEAADEQALRSRSPQQLSSTVLVAPHHGGKGSSTPEFIKAVGARHAVFSAGYRNPFGHPHPAVLERYAASRQWRTDRDGALHIVLGVAAAEVTAWRDEHRRYWFGQ